MHMHTHVQVFQSKAEILSLQKGDADISGDESFETK